MFIFCATLKKQNTTSANATTQIADEKVDHYYRQHPSAEGALEPFRQFPAKLDAKYKENTYQSKQRTRRPCRRSVLALKQKIAESIRRHVWSNRQITGNHARYSSQHPEHHKL